MKSLASATSDELLAELKRREDEARKGPTPAPDFTRLVKTVVEGINQAVAEQFENDDFRQYVYEAALNAVYGPDFFKWRNKW